MKSVFSLSFVFLAGICFASVLHFGCGVQREGEAPSEEHEHQAEAGVIEIHAEGQTQAGLQFESVREAEIRNSLRVSGKVVVDQSRVVHIRPLAAGRIERVMVEPGMDVSAGQALVVLDYIELGELVSAYAGARSEVAVAEQSLKRAEELTRVGALAEAELQRRKADYETAKANLNNAEVKVKRFGIAPQEIDAREQFSGRSTGHSTLRSPRNGVLLQYDVAVGEIAQPESELFAIADLWTVWVEANVHESDLALVATGQEAAIESHAYQGTLFRGRVTKIGDILDVPTRTVRVRCEVPNIERKLKLEMFVDVAISTSETRKALLVSKAALQEIDHAPVVFVKRSETHFEKRNIKVGESTDSGVEVLSGLKLGETVVSQGSFSLKSEFLKAEIGSDDHGH